MTLLCSRYAPGFFSGYLCFFSIFLYHYKFFLFSSLLFLIVCFLLPIINYCNFEAQQYLPRAHGSHTHQDQGNSFQPVQVKKFTSVDNSSASVECLKNLKNNAHRQKSPFSLKSVKKVFFGDTHIYSKQFA
jgi:hypothetical protein